MHETVPPTPQRVCPHCAAIAETPAWRCPFCRRSYRRHTLAAIAAMLALFAVIVVGAVALMLGSFGDELDSELDRQVRTVRSDFERDVDDLQDEIRRELDRRLPVTTGPG